MELKRAHILKCCTVFAFWNTHLKSENETRGQIYQWSLSCCPRLLDHFGESRTFSPTSWVPTRLSVLPFSKNDGVRRRGHRAQGLWAAVAGSREITHYRVAVGSNNQIPPCGSIFTHTPLFTTSSSKSPPRLYFLNCALLWNEPAPWKWAPASR